MFSQEEIDKFHQDGFIIARNVIQGQELATLQQAASRVTSDGIAANDVTNHLYYDQLDGSRTYFRSERMWDRDPIFQAVTVLRYFCFILPLNHPHLVLFIPYSIYFNSVMSCT